MALNLRGFVRKIKSRKDLLTSLIAPCLTYRFHHFQTCLSSLCPPWYRFVADQDCKSKCRERAGENWRERRSDGDVPQRSVRRWLELNLLHQ